MSLSILTDLNHRLSGGFGLEYSYIPVFKEGTWNIALSYWSLSADSPEELGPWVEVHRALIVEAVDWKLAKKLVEALQNAESAKSAFQRHLSPDDRIRKLLLESQCELCS